MTRTRWLLLLLAVVLVAASVVALQRRAATPEAAPAATCPVPDDLRVVGRATLRRIDRGGPLVDRELRATRPSAGRLCLDLVVGHSDPGADVASYRIVARQGDRTWTQEGLDPSGRRPLAVDGATGCLDVTGELTLFGAGDRTYRSRARLRVGCPT